jgi:hypothetical protein
MMHKLTYKAQLSQKSRIGNYLTGAATPCLPTIPAEGKTSNLSICRKITYLHVRQPVARLQNGNYRRGGSPRTGAASGMFILIYARGITGDLQQMQQLAGRHSGHTSAETSAIHVP